MTQVVLLPPPDQNRKNFMEGRVNRMLEMSYSFTIYGLASNCREGCGQLLRYCNFYHRIYEGVSSDNDEIFSLKTHEHTKNIGKTKRSMGVPRIEVRWVGCQDT